MTPVIVFGTYSPFTFESRAAYRPSGVGLDEPATRRATDAAGLVETERHQVLTWTSRLDSKAHRVGAAGCRDGVRLSPGAILFMAAAASRKTSPLGTRLHGTCLYEGIDRYHRAIDAIHDS